jgi:hypothetical protein
MDEPSESAKNGPIGTTTHRKECNLPQMSCQVGPWHIALKETKAAENSPDASNETAPRVQSSGGSNASPFWREG